MNYDIINFISLNNLSMWEEIAIQVRLMSHCLQCKCWSPRNANKDKKADKQYNDYFHLSLKSYKKHVNVLCLHENTCFILL